jgi:DNA-directed RNA polymerase specialized sigma24 family protein
MGRGAHIFGRTSGALGAGYNAWAMPAGIAGMSRDHHSDTNYERFVAQNTTFFRSFLNRKLSGSRVEVDDVAQEALQKMWKQWRGWSTDPEERRRNANQVLRDCAIDALRALNGRSGHKRGRETPIDMQALDRPHDDAELRQPLTREVAGRIVADALAAQSDSDVDEIHAAILATLAVLDWNEKLVFFAVNPLDGRDGISIRQAAANFGLNDATARGLYANARNTVLWLTNCALGKPLGEQELADLTAYAAGQLKGPKRKHVRRHVAECENCRAVLDAQREVAARGAAIFLPLPMLIGLANVGSAAAAAGTGVAVATSGGVALSGATGAAGGGMLAGAGSKLAASLATIAIAAGSVAAMQSKPAPEPQRLPVQAAAPATTPSFTPVSSPVPTREPTRPKLAKPAKRPPKRKPASTPTPAPFVPAAPASQPAKTRPAGADPSSPGDFVLGANG